LTAKHDALTAQTKAGRDAWVIRALDSEGPR
jgi:hypothetical protein